MKNEVEQWLAYAEENFKAAKRDVDSHLYNVCLQNAQQAIEKYLKALMLHLDIPLKKTHQVVELLDLLSSRCRIDISREDAVFLDSIYLPSKYPLGNVLPDYVPDQKICSRSINIVDQVRRIVVAEAAR